MRRTRKYEAALSLARKIKLPYIGEPSHEDLYKLLERESWGWDGDAWTKRERPVTSSMFGDDDAGSGLFRLRCMAHPDQIDDFVQAVANAMKHEGYKVAEISEKYANRRGVGTRVYMTLMDGEPSRRETITVTSAVLQLPGPQ